MTTTQPTPIDRPVLDIAGAVNPSHAHVLTPQALGLVEALARGFAPRIHDLLDARAERRRRLAAGELRLDFPASTAALRAAPWRVAPLPADLERRTVEITGPVDAKMIINALNSGADVFMADFEDANAPTWENQIAGQAHLAAAVRRALRYDDPATGKAYRLNERLATLMVRPRGLHLPEAHLRLDGGEIPGALVDFGLFMAHNAAELVRRGSGPYFYLPKLESRHEARLWNDVFLHTQDALGLPPGTIKATVLIETLPAAFEMDEILYELREHSAGLNCGRWDYIFSTIKTLGHDPARVLPDRSQVTMEQPFLRAYTQLAVRTCHRRGAPAIGGMAAQIPIKGDPAANAAALAKVTKDKRREAEDGHDGTWVAHPALVPVAREVFQARMTGPNQLDRRRDDVRVEAADLLAPPTGTRTEEGLRLNVRVGVRYLEAWLGGTGCVPLYHVMEDAATAEISRAQIWQWIRHRARLDDGRPVTPDLVERVLGEELTRIEGEVGAERFRRGRFPEAVRVFLEVATGPELVEFLTLPAYRELNRLHDTESEEASIV